MEVLCCDTGTVVRGTVTVTVRTVGYDQLYYCTSDVQLYSIQYIHWAEACPVVLERPSKLFFLRF